MYKIIFPDCTCVYNDSKKLLKKFPTETEADEYIDEHENENSESE